MNTHFLHELSMAAEAHGVYAEDTADRLASKYTSIGLLALAAVTVMRQYVFKPIQCWVPANWPRPWEEFAESYCWTQGTYRVSLGDAGHPAVQVRGESAISYYQWVPILLVAQAVLVLAPHQLWCMAARHFSGRDPHAVVRFAREVERAGHPAAKERLLAYTAWQLCQGPALRSPPPPPLGPAGRRRPRRRCSTTGPTTAMRRSGWALFAVYMASKAAYLLSAIGQLFILKSYLGFSSLLFGWHCARRLLSGGGSWEQTGIFPRVTFCDIPLRHVGQWSRHSVQCVLALNMVNEKIFIFLWFWFAFCCLASAASAVCWLVQLLPPAGRRSIVKSHLRLLANRPTTMAKGEGEEVDEAGQIACRLRPDGLFLLQMIADNADCVCAAHVLHRLVAAPPPERVGDGNDDDDVELEEDDADADDHSWREHQQEQQEESPPPPYRTLGRSEPADMAAAGAAIDDQPTARRPLQPFGRAASAV